MKDFLELASTRRSIRKFENKDIPQEDIDYFIKAAVNAPSGCNSQCWRFITVRNKDVINEIAAAVIKKIEEVLSIKNSEINEQYLISKRKMATFFVNAPVVIAVFMTHLEYYDPVFTDALKEQGYSHEDIMRLSAYPDLLSIGAAVQNLLLAVHEKGYGACWMNEPAIAGMQINEILGVPFNQKFISLVPIGYSAYTPRNKQMKDMNEVYGIIK